MWNKLPLDLLSHVFSFLPPDSLALSMSTCKTWRTTALIHPLPTLSHAPWFLAIPTRYHAPSCYAFNPCLHRWHSLPLHFVPHPIRLLAPISSLLLCKLSSSPTLRLLLLNPFTRQYKLLPKLTTRRSNPAIGVIIDNSNSFRVYVAGGASGAGYEPTLEVYDSTDGNWRNVGPMPVEFAVRLTVWTPNESVYAKDGVIYWMTSARAYSVVGFDVGKGVWREVKVPMADRLEWAALVRTGAGRVGLVGGAGDGEGRVWELGDGDEWVVVEVVKIDEGRFRGSSTKCVGSGEAVYLFRDLGNEMLVWREGKFGKNWCWVEGCSVSITPIKAVLLHPSLSPSSFHWNG